MAKNIIENKIKDMNIARNLKNHNYVHNAEKASMWIERYTVKNHAIAITSKNRREYEEVTGYYIPTLLEWGFRDKAIAYAKWLCSVQRNNGAWSTYDGKSESIFNTGQVLRGLIAIYEILPEVKGNITKGCDWLISNMDSQGRMKAIDESVWKTAHKNSELIHLYCLPPLREAGIKFDINLYVESSDKILSYYKRVYINDIVNFNYLSHFYAYCLEALVDLGEVDLVQKGMEKVARLQRLDGAVPAYKDVDWYCSTGVFQFAIIWFKLGNYKRGCKAFDYACKLQNTSGGWNGSYYSYRMNTILQSICNIVDKKKPNYFIDAEISWAVKYFFDALYLRQKLHFETCADIFLMNIKKSDEKYQSIYNEISKLDNPKVLDVGCGKGRYLRRLHADCLRVKLHGVDCSKKVLEYVNDTEIDLKVGSILKIPYTDELFDVVYSSEALEHAILIGNAIREMVRVTKQGGKVIIIDKRKEVLERVKYEKWFVPEELRTKQYFDVEGLKRIMSKEGLKNLKVKNLKGENDIFTVWIGEKRE